MAEQPPAAGSASTDVDAAEDEPPDESTLLGVSGVQAEVLADLARAEGDLADPDAEEPDERGAQV